MDSSWRILICDHDGALLTLIASWLDEQGFQTVSVRESDFVPETMRATDPELVILDLQLRCSSADLTVPSSLAAGGSRFPIALLLTATDAAALHQAVALYREQPALLVDGIAKPFDLDDLLGKIRQLLEARARL